MTIYDKYTEHHSYQIQKITNKEKKDLLFLRSGVNQLKYVGDMYKARQAVNEDGSAHFLTD